jgi:hypothetical protein
VAKEKTDEISGSSQRPSLLHIGLGLYETGEKKFFHPFIYTMLGCREKVRREKM